MSKRPLWPDRNNHWMDIKMSKIKKVVKHHRHCHLCLDDGCHTHLQFISGCKTSQLACMHMSYMSIKKMCDWHVLILRKALFKRQLTKQPKSLDLLYKHLTIYGTMPFSPKSYLSDFILNKDKALYKVLVRVSLQARRLMAVRLLLSVC